MFERHPSETRRRAFASASAAACAALAALAALGAAAAPLTVSVTDEQGKPLADAVVYVLAKGLPARAPATAQIEQRGKEFVPRVTVIQTGTAVRFPNNDSVRHHVYSFSPVRAFDLKLYAGTPSEPVVFDKPGTAVLGCNVHDRMNAWVHVVDTPLFATTDADGRATLDVPAGAHRLRAWHFLQPEPGLPVEQALLAGAVASQAAVRIKVAAAQPVQAAHSGHSARSGQSSY